MRILPLSSAIAALAFFASLGAIAQPRPQETPNVSVPSRVLERGGVEILTFEVERQWRVDPDRVFVMGHSMGGGGRADC